MPASPWLARLLARARRSKGVRPQRSGGAPTPLRLEWLEERLAPANTTFAAGVLTVDLNNANEAATLTNDGANITLTSNNTITGAGSSFATAGVTKLVLTDAGNNAGQSITFAGTSAYALPGGLDSTGVETNTFNAAVTTTGASSLSVTAPQSIVVSASLTGGTGGTTLLALGTAALDSIGVWVQNGAVVSATAGGAVSVTGTGGAGAGGSNIGVNIDASGQVTSGGAVSVTGTGGAAAAGSNNLGVVVNNNGAITSGSGVNVTGTAGAGSQAVVVKNGGVISTTSNAPVSVTADSVDIVSPGAINSGTGTTTIRTRTAGTLIDLGGPAVLSGNPLTLGLTADELNQITAGTLVVGDISSGTATVSAAIALNGKSLAVVTGAGMTGPGDITNGSAPAATLTIDQPGTSTYSGRIGGPAGGSANDKNLSFAKQGAGTLTLSGASTYTGTTTVSAGTLLVTGTSGTGDTTVNSGGTIGGTGTVGGGLAVQSGGTLRPGAGGVGTLNVAGALAFNAGSTFLVDVGPGGAADRVAVSLDITIANGTQLRGSVTGPLAAVSYPLLTTTQGSTVGTTGFQDVTGVNLPPPSGGPITVDGLPFAYRYGGGAAFELTPFGAVAVLDTSGNLDVNTLVNQADQITVSRAGGNLRLHDPNNTLFAGAGVTQVDAHTVELPFAVVTGQLQLTTGGGDDLVTLDLAGGGVLPAGGVVYAGGAGGNDKLSVRGSGTQTAIYTPSATTNGEGTVVVDGRTITFTGLEPVDMSGMLVAIVSPPNADDVLTVANGFDFATGTIPALVVSGTSGGVGLESVALWNNATVLITTTAADGADTVTIASANNAHHNTNLVIDTGTNSDSLTVAGAVAAAGDIKFFSTTITVNGSVTSTAGGDVALLAIDSGSAGDKLTINNDITVAGGTGTITLFSQEDLAQNAAVRATGVGDVAAVASGALTMSATATTFSGGGNIVYRGAAGLAAGSFNTTGGVGLESAVGAITDANGAAANVSAGSLVMTAGAGLGAGDALETAVASLAASAQGDVAVTNAGGLAVTDVSVTATTSEFSTGLSAAGAASTAGGVTISAGSINLLKPVTAAGTVTLTATAGDIAAGGAGPHVTAAALALSAVTGIGVGNSVQSAVSHLEAETATGGIFLLNTGDLTVGGVSAALSGVQVTGAAGQVALTVTGSLSVTLGSEVVHGPGLIALESTGDIRTGGNNGFFNPPLGAVASTGGPVMLTAGGDVVIGDAATNQFGDVTGVGISLTVGGDVVVTANSGVIARGSGPLIINTAGDVLLTQPAGPFGPALITEGGVINVFADGDFLAVGGTGGGSGVDSATQGAPGGDIVIEAASIELGDAVDAGLGNVTLTATAGSITDTTAGANRVFANQLFATALTGIVNLETAVTFVTATVAGVGGISLSELDDLDVLSATTANGGISLAAGGATRVRNVVAGTDDPSNSVVLTTAAGDMTVETVTAGLTAGATLTASAGSVFDDGVNTTRVTAGSLLLTADRAIGAPGATGQIDTAVTRVEARTTGAGPFSGAPTPGIWIGDVDDLIVDNTSTGDGVILIDAGANLDARSVTAGGTGRNLRLQAQGGDLTVGVVSAAGDTALLTATGAITDGNAAGADVTAARLGLKAGTGIGAGNALDTAVSTLAWGSGTGGIALANAGDLTVNDVSAFGQTVFGGSGMGSADASSTLSLTVATGVSMNGDITLTAGELADFPTCANDLTVNAGVLVSSTLGAITLRAGDDVVVQAGANVQAATALAVVAAFNDLDNCGGAVLDGTLVAGTNLAVCVNDDLSVGTFSATSGTVSLRSVNGQITDGNGGDTNVFAQALAMRANTGIGVGDAIEAEVARLEAETATGGIFVANVADAGTPTDLAIGGVNPDACVGDLAGVKVLTGGDIRIDGSGDILIGTPGDTVAGPGNLALIAQGVLTVTQDVTSTAAADGAAVTLTGNGGVTIHGGARVANGTGQAITLAVTGTGSAGHKGGVEVDGATLNAGGGDLTITGTGVAGTAAAFGVALVNGAVVEVTGAGTVVILGTGGAGTDDNVGVLLQVAGTRVIAADGSMTIFGTGKGGGGNNHGVVLSDAAVLKALGAGLVSVTGVAGGGTTAANLGVFVDGAGTEITSGGGSVEVVGYGAEAQADGVLISGGAAVSAPGSVLISGTGGAGAVAGNVGIHITGAGTAVTAGGGGVQVLGSGNGTGSSGQNYGVLVSNGAAVGAVGAGTVTVIGSGGTTGGDDNVGVLVSGAGSGITSGGGLLRVIGDGGGSGASTSNHGVVVRAGAVVAGTGTAPVTVTGTGGTGDSTGVRIDGAGSAVSTVNGALAVTGTSVNAGPSAVGIDVVDSAAIQSSGAGSVTLTGTSVNPDVTAGLRLTSGGRVQANTGDVTLNAEEMDFLAGTSVTGNAQLFVKPLSAARGLSLGAAANQAGKLSLTAGEIAAISPTFTLITIGRGDTSGAATVDGTATFGTDAVLQTPGAGSGGIRATATLSVGANDLVLVSGSNIATAGAGLFQANTVAMFAATGIGAPGAPVQTMASNIEAVTETGGVFIRNAVALTIGGARPDLTGIDVNGSGDVEVSSGGKLTVREDVTTKAGNVRLVARDSAAAGDDLAVLANVASQSGGSLSLRAGDNLTIDPAARLTTSGAGTILLEVDATSADAGVGGTATFHGTSLIAPAGATALGNGDNDTFTFTPSADTPITVNGATPAVAPGDTLNLDLTGFTGKVLQLTELRTATATFAATAKDVKIVSVEDVNLTGGNFQVLLDLAQASLNGVPFGNGTGNPDAVRVSLDGTGTDLLIAAAQNGQPLIGYFAMNLSGARALSLAGSADRTDFSLAESAGRLPTFSGTAVGSHNDAGQLPQGTFTVGNVGLSVRGGATGTDPLALLLQTSRALSYFADPAGGGGGNVEVANALRLSFGALGGLTVDGNNGTLVADATLVNATAFTLGAAAPDDGLSLIDGNGGFTDVLFGGFNQLTLRGGTGSQSMTLSSLDALDAALQALTISGDNVRHDDPAPDFLTVHALRAGLAGTFVGGAGNDVFEVVPGSMTILGDAGANRLVINGSATAANQNVTITGSTVNGGGNYNVSYQAAGGNFANGVLVLTGDGADTVTVNGTAGPTGVGTGVGDDSVTVASTAALRTRLVGTLLIDAGEGDNALSVSDVGNSVGGTYDVGQSTLAGPGWRVDYHALNGSYNQLSFLAGLGNDLVRTLGVGAAHVLVNAAPGNDTLRVFVGGNNLPTGLEVRGGLGTNSLQTIDTTGGALIRDFRTGPRSGLIQVSYQANTPTGYRYQHINAVLGINASVNYVKALYRHVLGRNPLAPEINAQIGLLNAQGRLAVVHGLETSAAGRAFLVQEWFLMFFGRNPTPAESAPLVQALLAGQSEEAVLGAMLGSPTLPHTAAFRAQMVTAYYRDLMRRPPTAAELNSAVSSAQGLQTIRELLEISETFFLYGV